MEIKYGDEFQTTRRKQKFHAEKVSQDLFQLHILNVEDSDQGKYRCAVEEWLWSTNSTWNKLGEQTSGLTELKLRPTGKPCKCPVHHQLPQLAQTHVHRVGDAIQPSHPLRS